MRTLQSRGLISSHARQHDSRAAEGRISLVPVCSRRYFDEDFEGAASRCFKCGGSGHQARGCTEEGRARPCYLCAQFGHGSAECPARLCFRCRRPGHIARDCPNSYSKCALCVLASAWSTIVRDSAASIRVCMLQIRPALTSRAGVCLEDREI